MKPRYRWNRHVGWWTLHESEDAWRLPWMLPGEPKLE